MGWSRAAAVRVSALGIAVFQVVGTFGAASNQPERRDLDVLAILLVLAGPAALAVRDRFPRTAIVLALASTEIYLARGYPYGPIFLSVVVALVYGVLAGRRRDTWVLAAAGLIGFVVADLIDPRSDGARWLHWLLVAGWLALVLVAADLAHARREQVQSRVRAAQEERRRRVEQQRLGLAQELHDVLAHHISLVNVQASVALHLLDRQPEQARPALTAIKAASSEALQELRSALDLLRADGDDGLAPRSPAPRLAELPALVDAVRASGLDVRLDQQDLPADLPAAVELAAYRIVQEALTNTTRHAQASRATVTVGYDGDVLVEVVDDGSGSTSAAPPVPGNGLVGMRERATALGGDLDAGPNPGGGFRVAARLPVGAS
jgi:signal transduction histidine kinase